MKKILVIIILVFAAIQSNSQTAYKKFYVSTDGNDSWSGSLSEPNKNKDDGPFNTIYRAKEEIKNIKGSIKTGTIEVYFRKGTYLIDKPIIFDTTDSSNEEVRIIFKAFPEEEVIFSGAKEINGFTKLSDKNFLKKFNRKVKSKIYEYDLKANGFSDLGYLKPQGFGRLPKKPLQMELYFDNKPMLLAQYPNKDWLIITDVPQDGDAPKNPGEAKVIRDGVPSGRHFGKFIISDKKPAKWKDINDVWIHGYFAWDWADSYDKVKSIDTKLNIVYPDTPYNHYGYVKGQRIRFINVPEELDIPGEYYIDRNSGKLFFYPPNDIAKGKSTVTVLNDIMISFQNCSNVSFQNIIFESSRGGAVKIKDGRNINFSGCVFRNFGNDPILIEGGFNNGITSCDIYNNAAGGIFIEAGDRFKLEPAGNYVDNCTIHDFGRIFRTYAPAISLNGVGNRATHNHIFDAPHMGIYFIGNDHLIEYNEINHIAKETGDVGAIYTGRDYTSRGTIVRYNYLHELHGPGLCGVMGVYLDDFSSGITIYGNIFYKAGHAVMLGGGRDHTIENNIFVECDPSIFIDGRGMFRNVEYFDGRYNALWDKVKMYNIKEPPYSSKYPELLTVLDPNPAIPKNNKILNNVSFGGRFLDLYSGLDFTLIKIEKNIIADPIILRRSERSDIETDKFTNYDIEDKEIVYKFSVGGNSVTTDDPGFVNFANKDFRLKKESKAFEIGFKEIPVKEIGLYKNEFRK